MTISLEKNSPPDYTYTLQEVSPFDNKTFEVIINPTKTLMPQYFYVDFPQMSLVYDNNHLQLGKNRYQIKMRAIKYLSPAQQAVLTPVKATMATVAIAAVATTGPMIVLAANPYLLWVLLQLFQKFLLLQLINVQYPENVVQFFNLFKACTLNFLPNPFGALLGGYDVLEEQSLQGPGVLPENDIDGLFLINNGGMFLGWILLIIFYPLSAVLMRVRALPSHIKRINTRFYHSCRFNVPLRFWLSSYLQMCLGAWAQIWATKFDNLIHSFSSVLAVVVISLNLGFPYLVFKLINEEPDRPKLREKLYGTLTE